MLNELLADKKIILGSKSPRRQELLKSIGVSFETKSKDTEEVYPSTLPFQQVAEYLSKLKAKAFLPELSSDEIIITSDTTVCLKNSILGKASNELEAKQMLQAISNGTHQVITGVTILSLNKEVSFSDSCTVHFKALTTQEIDYYIANYKPFDKAGSYGIQEWIGQIGITKIEGSYFTVMGLPTHLVYKELLTF